MQKSESKVLFINYGRETRKISDANPVGFLTMENPDVTTLLSQGWSIASVHLVTNETSVSAIIVLDKHSA